MARSLRNRKKLRTEKKSIVVEDDSLNDNPTSEVLDDDCLKQIFEYLPISDRIRLQRVSKRWRVASRRSWKSFRTLNFTYKLWNHNGTISKKALKDVLKLCGKFLTVLDTSKVSVNLAENINMQSFLKFCPNLTFVNLTKDDAISIGRPFIRSLIKYCKNIVELSVIKPTAEASFYFANGTVLSAYTNLRVLNLEKSWFLGGTSVDFQNNNSIEELRLNCCGYLNIQLLGADLLHFQKLHTLSLQKSLSDCNDLFSNLDFIKQTNIKSLDISNNRILDDNYLIKIGHALVHLRNLSISDKTGKMRITDMGLQAVVSPNLEYLKIDGLNIEGSSLLNLPLLKRLSCKYCKNLNAEHFQLLFDTSNRLETIDLEGVDNVRGIITRAIESVKSRTNDVVLKVLVNKVNIVDITDIPNNLQLFEYQNGLWYGIKSTAVKSGNK